MNRHLTVTCGALAAAFAVAPAAPLAAQSAWDWTGTVTAGQTIEIVGIEGDVRATPAAGAQARVQATKTARAGDPDVVRIVAIEHTRGVTICAVYPTREGGPDNECAPGGGTRNVENVRVRVDFKVDVPPGVHFRGSTVSGDVRAHDMTADVRASSVSGDVIVSTTGAATASTVSGNVDVSMGRPDPEGMSFSTVSGDITLRIAWALQADVRFTTVSGRLESDFPVTLHSGGRRGLDGRIGGGGLALRFTTVSGNVELRRQ